MDQATSQAISAILTAILGTGGIATVLAAVKAWRTRHHAPQVEQQAVAHVSADWEALNKYWRSELSRVRQEQKDERTTWNKERDGYRRRVRWLARRVDQLEHHIWLGLPPPPPVEEPEGEGTDSQ